MTQEYTQEFVNNWHEMVQREQAAFAALEAPIVYGVQREVVVGDNGETAWIAVCEDFYSSRELAHCALDFHSQAYGSGLRVAEYTLTRRNGRLFFAGATGDLRLVGKVEGGTDFETEAASWTLYRNED